MQRQPVITKDGSHTIAIPEWNVTYHSLHGAIQESKHVFIEAGLSDSGQMDRHISLCEIGFGTGLNALLTLIETEQPKTTVNYTALELFPLEIQQVRQLNYCNQLHRPDLQLIFEKLHECEWEKVIPISPVFTLHKKAISLQDYQSSSAYDVIYFDAFAPRAQPELWTATIFQKLINMMHTGGILVTYCSKGDVRRAMQAAGFRVERLQGPIGKREMLRGRRMD